MGAVILKFRKKFPGFQIEGDFTFNRGFNVILGPSGSGKTTTLRVMSGLERADEGFMKCCEELFFDMERGFFLPPQKRRVGIVFQEDNLLPHLTVRGNIEFALRKARDRNLSVDKLMHLFRIENLRDKKIHELSGGQRQRVAIVRALAYEPRALLMDEPFSSLDFRIKLNIISFLRRLELRIPVVIVTHDPVDAFLLGDRVFLMEEGKKVAEGGRELVKNYFSDIEQILSGYSS